MLKDIQEQECKGKVWVKMLTKTPGPVTWLNKSLARWCQCLDTQNLWTVCRIGSWGGGTYAQQEEMEEQRAVFTLQLLAEDLCVHTSAWQCCIRIQQSDAAPGQDWCRHPPVSVAEIKLVKRWHEHWTMLTLALMYPFHE